MLRVTNPATEEVIRELEEDRPSAISEKVRRAYRAQPGWAARPLKDRLEIVRRFKELVGKHQDRLAKTLTMEMGKPVTQATNELKALAGRIDYFLVETKDQLEEEEVYKASGIEERLAWEPLGIVANVSAWNYPYFVGSNVFVPALLCGNAVLYKPSELVPLTGLAIAELLWEAGVPKDVFAPVIGGAAVGQALLEHQLQGVFFTGSHAAGKKIAQQVAPGMTRLQLELGGKDATYVCEDADVKTAAQSLADGAMYNTGQSCCSVERIYVHESIYGAFLEHFVEEVKGFVVGDPTDANTYIGPLARKQQLDVLDAQVADAVQRGGKVLCGGKRRQGKGYYYEPTVISEAQNGMRLMREESFGPVIGIGRVRDDNDGVDRVNDSEYGLTAGVYTKDGARARAIMARFNAGTVYWNCCDRVSPRLPWTGRRHSGVGSTLGKLGIRAFVQPKAYHLKGE